MTTLHLILDDYLRTPPPPLRRYLHDLTNALIQTAPDDCGVNAVVAGHDPARIEQLKDEFPGLSDVTRMPLPSQALEQAWLFGLKRTRLSGLVHSPTLMAPLTVNAEDQQTVVTITDTTYWEHPERLGRLERLTMRRLIDRAEKYANAVIVESEAQADVLDDQTNLGQRIRVFPPVPSTSLQRPPRTTDVARALDLPAKYFLAVVQPGTRWMGKLASAIARLEKPLPVVAIGLDDPQEGRAFATGEGLTREQITFLPPQEDHQLAAIAARATGVLMLTDVPRWVYSLTDLIGIGTPLISPRTPVNEELAGGTGIMFAPEAANLAEAMDSIARNRKRGYELKTAQFDRAKFFTWDDYGRRIWQLHADL